MKKIPVLIVDDQPGVRRLMMELLGRKKYVFYEACTGQDAIELLDTYEVAIVFLDVKMPQMDGLQTLQKLLSCPSPPPVVMMTAQGQESLGKFLIEHGAANYIEKPFDITMVENMIHKYAQKF